MVLKKDTIQLIIHTILIIFFIYKFTRIPIHDKNEFLERKQKQKTKRNQHINTYINKQNTIKNYFYAEAYDIVSPFTQKSLYWGWIAGSNARAFNPGIYNTPNVESSTTTPGARTYVSSWTVESKAQIYMFGGLGYDGNGATSTTGFLSDLWRFDINTLNWTFISSETTVNTNLMDQYAVYGFGNTPDAENHPGGRQQTAYFMDSNEVMWMFGGDGYASSGARGYLRDMWKYDPNGVAQWEPSNYHAPGPSSQFVDQPGTYASGTQSDLIPGARAAMTFGIDSTNKLWMYGGIGMTSTANAASCRDLWYYDTTTNLWHLEAGDDQQDIASSFGTQGVTYPATTHFPGSRDRAAMFIHPNANIIYIFGGFSATSGKLQDLWKYDITGKTWTWVSGSSSENPANTLPNYGTIGVEAPTNIPGGRYDSLKFDTKSTIQYIFGGEGVGSVFSCPLLDLWQFNMNTEQWTFYAVPESTGERENGEYNVKYSPLDADNTFPGSRKSSGSWIFNNTFYLFGGRGRARSGGFDDLDDLWRLSWHYRCNNHEWSWSTVCSGHGDCIEPENCNCTVGYTGTDCEFPICNEIPSNNAATCSSHGTCIDYDTCTCQTEYVGQFCQYSICYGVAGNESTVCSGHGACNAPDNCTCETGYRGNNCEVIQCNGIWSDEAGICSNHGTCVSYDNCSCAATHGGNDCQFPICYGYVSTDTANVCSGHGTCVNPDNCNCVGTHTGNNCQYPICNGIDASQPTVCSGHGNCTAPDTCACDPYYHNTYCTEHSCFGIIEDQPTVCSGHGTCTAPNTCGCTAQYDGYDCSNPICFGISANSSTVCNTNGNCTAPDTCTCEATHSGAQCQFPMCFGHPSNDAANVCHGHGTCSSPGVCDCVATYDGPECQYPVCFGVASNETTTCSANGTCTAPDTCNCNAFYGGNNCQFPICFGHTSDDTANVCSNHGNCISPGNCECTSTFTGPECQYPICFGVPSNETTTCSSHGTCSAPNTCNCVATHVGPNCQYPICFGVASNETTTCSSHGTCTSPDTCVCDSEHVGNNCQFAICYGLFANDTANVCSGNGACVAPDTCSCNPGYGSSNCSTHACNFIEHSNPNTCSAHGTCDAPDVCSCAANYHGQFCEVNICYGILSNVSTVCTNNGTCNDTDSCVCNPGHSGNQCQDYFCYGTLFSDGSVCSTFGSCIGPDNCLCQSGYGGANCSEYTCFDIPYSSPSTCSSHGSCDAIDTCTCSPNYSGSFCNETTCGGIANTNPAVCSSNGVCTYFDNCTCQTGYNGDACQFWNCSQIDSANPNVCSAHGTCASPDNCNCQAGYTDAICSSFECYGLSHLDTNVCTGNGNCTSPENCVCNTGYSSGKCDVYFCDSILYNDSSVCSTHGTCDTPNTCTCQTGYIGQFCADWNCNGIAPSNPGVCSGHGVCQAPNSCSCNGSYYGADCNDFDCGGINQNSPNVCTGIGTCTGPNSCNCPPGSSGLNCEVFDCYSVPQADSNSCGQFGQCVAPNNCSCTTGYFGNVCSDYQCDNILNSNDSACTGKGSCVSPDLCSCNFGYTSASYCSTPFMTITPNSGYELITQFRVNLPFDVNLANATISISFTHTLTGQTVSPIFHPTIKNQFSMQVYGNSNANYNIDLQVTLTSPIVTFTQTISIRVSPLLDICNQEMSDTECSTLFKNFTDTNVDPDRPDTEIIDVVEAASESAYDCSKLRNQNAQCLVESISYERVNCFRPNSATGICNQIAQECSCASGYTGLDCKILAAELPQLQQFQLSLVNSLDSVVATTAASSDDTLRDLKITNCMVNDYHTATPDILTNIITHTDNLIDQTNQQGNQVVMSTNANITLDTLSKMLQLIYDYNVGTAVQKIGLIENIYRLVNKLSEVAFTTLLTERTLTSNRIVVSLAQNTQLQLRGTRLGSSPYFVELPSNTDLVSSLNSADVTTVIFTRYHYNLYSFTSESVLDSGVNMVRAYSGNVKQNIEGLPSDDGLVLLYEGSYPNATLEIEGYDKTFDNTTCQFWDTSGRTWSNSGCVLESVTATTARCVCSHATDFGLFPVQFSFTEVTNIPWWQQIPWWAWVILGSALLLCCILCYLLCLCLCLCIACLRRFKIVKRGKKQTDESEIMDLVVEDEETASMVGEPTDSYMTIGGLPNNQRYETEYSYYEDPRRARAKNYRVKAPLELGSEESSAYSTIHSLSLASVARVSHKDNRIHLLDERVHGNHDDIMNRIDIMPDHMNDKDIIRQLVADVTELQGQKSTLRKELDELRKIHGNSNKIRSINNNINAYQNEETMAIRKLPMDLQRELKQKAHQMKFGSPIIHQTVVPEWAEALKKKQIEEAARKLAEQETPIQPGAAVLPVAATVGAAASAANISMPIEDVIPDPEALSTSEPTPSIVESIGSGLRKMGIRGGRLLPGKSRRAPISKSKKKAKKSPKESYLQSKQYHPPAKAVSENLVNLEGGNAVPQHRDIAPSKENPKDHIAVNEKLTPLGLKGQGKRRAPLLTKNRKTPSKVVLSSNQTVALSPIKRLEDLNDRQTVSPHIQNKNDLIYEPAKDSSQPRALGSSIPKYSTQSKLRRAPIKGKHRKYKGKPSAKGANSYLQSSSVNSAQEKDLISSEYLKSPGKKQSRLPSKFSNLLLPNKNPTDVPFEEPPLPKSIIKKREDLAARKKKLFNEISKFTANHGDFSSSLLNKEISRVDSRIKHNNHEMAIPNADVRKLRHENVFLQQRMNKLLQQEAERNDFKEHIEIICARIKKNHQLIALLQNKKELSNDALNQHELENERLISKGEGMVEQYKLLLVKQRKWIKTPGVDKKNLTYEPIQLHTGNASSSTVSTSSSQFTIPSLKSISSLNASSFGPFARRKQRSPSSSKQSTPTPSVLDTTSTRSPPPTAVVRKDTPFEGNFKTVGAINLAPEKSRRRKRFAANNTSSSSSRAFMASSSTISEGSDRSVPEVNKKIRHPNNVLIRNRLKEYIVKNNKE